MVSVILASGRGVRMGGPKALLAWDEGLPLAVAHARAFQAFQACSHSVVVVVRDAVARQVRPLLPGVRVIPSAAPGPWGPAGSIAAAVRAGAIGASPWVLLTPVDRMPAKLSTLRTLLAAATPGVEAIRPKFEGRGGHPVIVRADLLVPAYLIDDPPPLRKAMQSWNCVDIEVDDADILADVNTPERYRGLTGREPLFTRSG